MVHSGMRSQYTPKHEKMLPLKFYYAVLITLIAVLIFEVGMLVYVTATSVIHGTVVDKVGQYTPVTTWLINEKRYTREEPSIAMKGWHVVVRDGDRYQTYSLSKKQYDAIQLNDSIWHFGMWTFKDVQ